MTLQEHQQDIAARIRAHADLGALSVIVEADVLDIEGAIAKALQSAFLVIIVGSGDGRPVGESRDPTLAMETTFVVTIGMIPGLVTPTLTPVQILDRLIAWLHFWSWSTQDGAGVYLVGGHAPITSDGGLTGHQLTLRTNRPVCA